MPALDLHPCRSDAEPSVRAGTGHGQAVDLDAAAGPRRRADRGRGIPRVDVRGFWLLSVDRPGVGPVGRPGLCTEGFRALRARLTGRSLQRIWITLATLGRPAALSANSM